LKAVKLDMTPEQVDAFLGRMNGVLMITGVPGTGKTTVAFQRIRFLFDQQDLREDGPSLPRYEPRLTRVFLASRNLIEYSTHLLQDELGVPNDVVSYVPDFVSTYVDSVWEPKVGAKPRQRRLTREDERAREAMFNLATAEDLHGAWRMLEGQVRDRLPLAAKGQWLEYASKLGGAVAAEAQALAHNLATAVAPRAASDPVESKIRMDAVWHRVQREYIACRKAMREADRTVFDRRFARWLMWVYDPLDVLRTYFAGRKGAARARIRSGMAGLVDADGIIEDVFKELGTRVYGPELLAWIAWLLRFSLPEESAPTDGFREIQRAIPQPDHPSERRWTHVVLDEAQDLAVQEASLLASFVHPRGALTVSADYHQVVSPVHGMTDGGALKFGLPIWDRTLHMQYSFNKNLRQSREIGQFLFDFHQHTFGEIPRFEPGDRSEGMKPAVYTTSRGAIPILLRQMYTALGRSKTVRRVAVIQVDDDLAAMSQLRAALERLGVRLAALGNTLAEGALVTTTVEQAKGLEFDACIVLGLDDLERASLNFSKNRAYVALSRPTQRLFMVCEHFPPLLQRMRSDLFEYHAVNQV
jgi:hypothetical protein